ncbi:MAG TPA: CHAT domain-containing protein, partial [Oscillatoriales cyanobacterium M59_W2019_021]|nr:CHAT domain-containing protein [Oscillatoriales cyanobacterium M59_W2019_021]
MEARSLSQLVTDARQQIQGGSPVRNSKGQIEIIPRDDSPPKNSNSFPALQKLYRILIEPIAEFLPQEPGSLVVFIPQGDLFLVPFAALQDDTDTYLIDRYAIATAPSIQVLDLLHQRRQTITGRATDILIVGNPTPPVVATAPDAEPQPFPPLPGAELEAIAIAQLFSTEALTGDQATKAAILDRMPDAGILHFATYNSSVWTGELPGAIVLASIDAAPSLLTIDDIQALNLNAELAILSFDDTALGQITGDGVIGLPRAFMAAGVPTVIAALWSVNDISAADLMLEFYHQLQQNSNPAQALRQA